MADFLSDEWIDSVRATLQAIPGQSDVEATIQYTITGAPNGKVVLGLTISRGVVVSLETGRLSKPSCKISLSAETAGQILEGTLDVDVAYMRGSIKVEGDHALWLVGMRSWRRAALAALAD